MGLVDNEYLDNVTKDDSTIAIRDLIRDKLKEINFFKTCPNSDIHLHSCFIDKYNKIDIIINMASISEDDELIDINKEDFMNVLEVNLLGAFLTTKIYNKYNDNGMIINISSTDGIDTYNKYNLKYATSKAALIFMSKNIQLCTNNKVICICPNWIDSNSTNEIDKEYLNNELKRINQSRLITKEELN